MSDSPFIIIHSLINSETGRTYKEDNLLLQHNIPVGTLVEVVADEEWPSESDGVRLHVIYHGRDCDGTPLYWLGINGDSSVENGRGHRTFGGYSETSLRVVDKLERVEE